MRVGLHDLLALRREGLMVRNLADGQRTGECDGLKVLGRNAVQR